MKNAEKRVFSCKDRCRYSRKRTKFCQKVATTLLEKFSRSGRLHDGRSAKFRQNVARFRLYRHRFLQENTRFAAFFKIYQILKLKFLKFGKILQISQNLQNFAEFSRKMLIFQNRCFAKVLRLQRCKSMQIL